MIERMLMERGIRKEDLEEFSRLDNHNGKTSWFSYIMQSDFEDLKSPTLKRLAEVLSIVAKDMDKIRFMVPEGQRKHLGENRYKELLGQLLAKEMHKMIRKHRFDDVFGLDQLYKETLEYIQETYK